MRGATLDLITVLRKIGLKSIIVAGPRSNSLNLPPDAGYIEVLLSNSLIKWLSKTAPFLVQLIEQILVTLTLIRVSKQADLVLFSHSNMPVPLGFCRILRKKTFVYSGGFFYKSVPDQKAITKSLVFFLESIYYKLAYEILVVSMDLAKLDPLKNHRRKTFEAPLRYLNKDFFDKFYFSLPSTKKNIIAFVGRFSWEKGVSEFAASTPIISSRRGDVKFFIIGDKVEQLNLLMNCKMQAMVPLLENRVVEIIPWVGNIEKYFKKIKILVLPSKSEGLPSIMLEAAASGTILLATPVGGLADFIVDGKTGFLLGSTDPNYIAQKILWILDRNQDILDSISENSYKLMRENYNEKRVINLWRTAFANSLRS